MFKVIFILVFLVGCTKYEHKEFIPKYKKGQYVNYTPMIFFSEVCKGFAVIKDYREDGYSSAYPSVYFATTPDEEPECPSTIILVETDKNLKMVGYK